ncbi:MAG TPA: hypothetical protein VN823_09230 [Stellaceae bacterium]|nr:hypothetical protein [Stellaceae bacterium]
MGTMVFAIGAGSGLLRRHPAVVRWQGKGVGALYCAVGIRLALQECERRVSDRAGKERP